MTPQQLHQSSGSQTLLQVVYKSIGQNLSLLLQNLFHLLPPCYLNDRVVESTIEGHDYEESEYEVEEVIDDDISDKSYYFKMFDKLLRRREEKIINNSANTNNNFLNK